jgi:formate dehydrogenase subunit gamma
MVPMGFIDRFIGNRAMGSLAWARPILSALAICTVLAMSSPLHAQQQEQIVDPQARVVNEQTLLRETPRIQGEIDQLDPRARVLIQPAGRVWDHFHEVTLHWLGAIVILATLAGLTAAYLFLGRIRISEGRSGRKVPRFSAFERFVHWLTAVSFVVLGISGLNVTFGKLLLLPLIGPDAFSAFSQWAKYAHNFTSFPFMLGIVLIAVMWIRDNIPDKTDIEWFRQSGGFIAKRHAPAGRFKSTFQKLLRKAGPRHRQVITVPVCVTHSPCAHCKIVQRIAPVSVNT